MSNVPTGALELCFLSGNPSSILPTMLGGSASSQASGAPFRTESDSRATVWPPPAHQAELFNRGYGIYSLFPGPAESAKSLYAPAVKAMLPTNPFQGFIESQKVPDAFFPTKFTLNSNRTSEFERTSVARSEIPHPDHIKTRINDEENVKRQQEQEQQLQLHHHQGASIANRSEVREVTPGKEARAKRLPKEVVIIKSEADEVNRVESSDKGDEIERERGAIGRNDEDDRRQCDKRKSGTCQGSKSVAKAQGGQANEPDSTDCRTATQETHRNEDITSSEDDGPDKNNDDDDDDNDESGGENIFGGKVDEKSSSENVKVGDDVFDKEKNILIDLSGGSGGDCCRKSDGRTNSKKCAKPKTPDSSCKSQTVNCKQFNNETSKSSPNRCLSVPTNNGGCSRTTPVTLKHSPKAQSGSGNGNADASAVSIKKEPMEFQKFPPNGSPYHGFTPLENLFNPTLRVLDGQILNTVPFPDSYESYNNRRKESFLSPGLDRSGYLASGHGFPSPRPVLPETPFLSPKLDLGEFSNYKNCRTIAEDYLAKVESPSRTPLGGQSCLSNGEDERCQEMTSQVNSTTPESEKKSLLSGTTSGSANVTPCQVAEVTSASALLSPKMPGANPVTVKQEVATGTSGTGSAPAEQKKDVAFTGQSTAVSSTVGVSLTRQRCQSRHEEMKMSLAADSPPSILHQTVQSPASIGISPAMGAAVYPGGIVCDDRPTSIWPAQAHNPGLWQYSAPIDYPSFPPVGFQLVRDPITGHFLLIPASNLEAFQRAILWPSYQPPPSQMIIPPISLQPNAPRLLLDTNVSSMDFLTPETMQRHTPQHRILITAEPTSNRKMMEPAVIKVETSEAANVSSAGPKSESGGIYTKTQMTSGNHNGFTHTPPLLTESMRSQASSTMPRLTPVQQKPRGSYRPVASAVLPDQSYNDRSKQSETTNERENDGSQMTGVIVKTKLEEPAYIGKPEMRETEDVPLPEEQPEDDKRVVLKEIRMRKELGENLNVNISNVPDVIVKKEIVSPSQVDLSGLELLSNSIEQLMCESKGKTLTDGYNDESTKKTGIEVDRKDLSNDACEGAVLLQNLKNGFREVDSRNAYDEDDTKNLGGLGLLCALAEQRFQEEIDKANHDHREISGGDERLRRGQEAEEKEEEDPVEDKVPNVEKESRDASSAKEFNSSCVVKQEAKDCESDFLYLSKGNETKHDVKMEEDDDEEEEEEQQQQKKMKGSEMAATEEKDLNLNEPENSCSKRGPGRPKKSKCKKLICQLPSSREANRKSKEMSPPVLEKQTDYTYNNGENNDSDDETLHSKYKADILKPPTLTPSAILDPVGRPISENSRSTQQTTSNHVTAKTENETSKKFGEDEKDSLQSSRKRKHSESDDASSTRNLSKKRKVGRPKKHFITAGTRGSESTTETIVAKTNSKTKTNSPFHLEEGSGGRRSSGEKAKNACGEEATPSRRTTTTTANHDDRDNREWKAKKIKPKLKAEPKVREWTPASDDANLIDWNKNIKEEKAVEDDDDVGGGGETTCRRAKAPKKQANGKLQIEGKSKKQKLQRCVLTADHINGDRFPMRTLTEMGGLFYAGHLSAIRAPDVYGITIDGERGNRPHIYSREEILKYSILEVKPNTTADLVPGTRCCAYWSEQYRCLYPGTVSAPTSPDFELDDRFINVEFDDGDSGRINIEDIRLLPEDYPIVEYDPNPLQSLSKRRRRISGASVESHSKERKSIESYGESEKVENETEEEETTGKGNEDTDGGVAFLTAEVDRKHLKKKRREKLRRLQSLTIDGKRKHKKHRCSDEHRHHKHHKKHRKHRHKHGTKREGDVNLNVNVNTNTNSNTNVNGIKTESEEKDKSEKHKVKKKKEKKNSTIQNEGENGWSAEKPKKCKERTDSVESRSKIAAFLPARQLWGWSGKGFKRPGAKGRARKEFYKTIQRGKERIMVGDCAVFLSTGRPDRPYIGRIESMWESWGTNMIVRVKWFYHPEETVGCPATLEYPGGLFESPHVDENDVQTISHKCEVLPLKEYTAKLGNSPHRYETIYDNNDIYYLAGYYDPTNTTLKMEPGVK